MTDPGAEAPCLVLPFAELTPVQVHDLARLRQDVFVVEQDCPYPDLDGRDVEPTTLHVLLLDQPGGRLLGCARVLEDDGGNSPLGRIGRVALAKDARGRGLADVVMRVALEACAGRDVVLDAQAPLAGWYGTHGFEVTGPEFLEDGIPHLPMRRYADR
ncbi:GNAT family N-acetyltransferase [Nocardioides marinquilinus]|uniref:GNAT family N-acetyltransferase n=1 Tax=Nocardioides marinquilinus TaxID=1210400 RepID=A0ABP9PI12_9ACTN